jgi:hypothetical protein
MKAILVVAVLLLVGIAGVGFYQGWFRLSTDDAGQQPSATITVDTDKIHADKETVKEKMQGLGQEAEDQTADPAEKVKQ